MIKQFFENFWVSIFISFFFTAISLVLAVANACIFIINRHSVALIFMILFSINAISNAVKLGNKIRDRMLDE